MDDKIRNIINKYNLGKVVVFKSARSDSTWINAGEDDKGRVVIVTDFSDKQIAEDLATLFKWLADQVKN